MHKILKGDVIDKGEFKFEYNGFGQFTITIGNENTALLFALQYPSTKGNT